MFHRDYDRIVYFNVLTCQSCEGLRRDSSDMRLLPCVCMCARACMHVCACVHVRAHVKLTESFIS